MTRDINAGPLLSGFPHSSAILTNPDTGQMTREGLRFFQLLWQRTGGGYDQIYDLQDLAANVEQLALLRRDVTALQQDLEAVRATSEEAVARKILQGDVVSNEIVTRALASRAATSTNFSFTNSFGPYTADTFSDTVFSDFGAGSSTGSNDSAGRELLTVEVSLTNVSPGDPLLIWFDGQLVYEGDVAQWICWHEKVWIMNEADTFKNDYFGASAPRSTSDDDYLTVNDGTRNMERLFNRVKEEPADDTTGNISLEANNGGAVLSYPINGITGIVAPSDIGTNPRKIVFAFVLDRDKIAYSSNNQHGLKNPNSAKDWQIDDLDVLVINLKEKQ